MPKFPSAKHEEMYNAYIMMFAQMPNVQHVSGDEMELVVYQKVDGSKYGIPPEQEAILAKFYVYGEGFNDDIIMVSDGDVIITPERAPLLHKVLDPALFENQDIVLPVPEKKKGTVRDVFFKYVTHDHMRNKESLRAYAVGETTMVNAYRENDQDELLVMTRGYDESYIKHNGTGVISLEAFHAFADRSALIRASLVAYYGNEGVEGK